MKLNKKTERLIKRKAAELKKLYETPNPEVDKIISELRAEATVSYTHLTLPTT